jgi:nitroreductase
MKSGKFIPYTGQTYDEKEMLERSKALFEWSNKRRSVRDFSDKPIPNEVIENIIKTASTAPSGANKQPWKFCVVTNKELKAKIRKAAEEEEYKSYNGRMSEEWLEDLEPLGTDWKKEFIDIAPAIIVVTKCAYDFDEEGNKLTNYYVNESVGLAAGFLLNAIHHSGLISLTHTPSPMNFLTDLLDRPKNERAFLLIPIGYPADNAEVPDISRKEIEEVLVYYS